MKIQKINKVILKRSCHYNTSMINFIKRIPLSFLNISPTSIRYPIKRRSEHFVVSNRGRYIIIYAVWHTDIHLHVRCTRWCLHVPGTQTSLCAYVVSIDIIHTKTHYFITLCGLGTRDRFLKRDDCVGSRSYRNCSNTYD